MLLLFFIPVPRSPVALPSMTDKLVHLLVFLGFAILYRIAEQAPAIRAFLVSAAYAGGVELIQGLTGYRSAEWADFLMGAAGALVGVLLVEVRRSVRSGAG